MSSLYLSPDELRELTGYQTRAAACRWLERNNWPYASPGRNGWPRVLRDYHDARMSGAAPQKAKRQPDQPNWSQHA